MVDGIKMKLLIGDGTPAPVSRQIIESLTGIEVTASSKDPSGFQLHFSLNANSILPGKFMLPDGSVPKMMRVIIAVTVNNAVEVLMDGVMTHHEVTTTGAGQTLTVTGEDLTRVMDYADFSGKGYPGTSPEQRAKMILSNYANLGITPKVIASALNDTPAASEHVPQQQGKDLDYLKQLADQLGHVFYLDPGPGIGQSTAYFGPEIQDGKPQPALSNNFGFRTNVESLAFTYQSETAAKAQGYTQNSGQGDPAAVSGDDPGGSPKLGAKQLMRKRDQPRHEMAKLTPGRAAQLQKAATARTQTGVSGTGKLDVLRYGRVLKSRQLVYARGGGASFDGIYHVRSVTHHLARGSFTQDFTLIRNGLMSTVSKC